MLANQGKSEAFPGLIAFEKVLKRVVVGRSPMYSECVILQPATPRMDTLSIFGILVRLCEEMAAGAEMARVPFDSARWFGRCRWTTTSARDVDLLVLPRLVFGLPDPFIVSSGEDFTDRRTVHPTHNRTRVLSSILTCELAG